MSIVAPQGRAHLSADALWRLVRSGFDHIPAQRCDGVDMAVPDACLSAFALFALQSPALLAFATERAERHGGTLDGLERVPCDTRMRERRDPVFPASGRPVCQSVFRQWQRGQAREPLAFLAGHALLALDGTGEVSSTTLQGASWLHKVHRHGSLTSSHQMLGAAMTQPAVRDVMPLMPEPIVRHDGTGKNACERHAATRLLTPLRHAHPQVPCMGTADSLRGNAPPMQSLHDHQLHDLLGVTEGAQPFVCTQGQEAEPAGRGTSEERHDRTTGLVPRGRLVNNVPLNASHMDVRVHVMASWEVSADQVHPCRGIPDLRGSTRHVFHLMRGGRARWQRAQETCNTLKNQGDKGEPKDGHGTHNLSVVCAMVRLLACVVDPPQQLCGAVVQAVWITLGRPRLWWERMRALGEDDAREARRQRLAARLEGLKKSARILAVDASSSQLVIASLGACVPSNQALPHRGGEATAPGREPSACTTSSSHA